jgi:hypothetical protein
MDPCADIFRGGHERLWDLLDRCLTGAAVAQPEIQENGLLSVGCRLRFVCLISAIVNIFVM